MLRSVDRFVDLGGIRHHLAPFYSSTGRPSVDPELMIRMLLVGYIMGIRSERRLCEEVHLNLAYRWFCRLGLEDAIPDHSTFSKNRHGRFRESDVFRWVVGLANWAAVKDRAVLEATQGAVRYWGICDEDMLRCQLAIEAPYRRTQRVASLEKLLSRKENPESA